MTMSVTYKFRSLSDMAAYYEGKAQELRERVARAKEGKSKLKQKEVDHLRGEAFSLEMVANQLRSTVIEGEPK